jgi:hypothetical protein
LGLLRRGIGPPSNVCLHRISQSKKKLGPIPIHQEGFEPTIAMFKYLKREGALDISATVRGTAFIN